LAAFLNKNVVDAYFVAQKKRWMTQGESENKRWEQLNPLYASYKLKKFKEYPFGGRKMMIATGFLWESVTSRSKGFKKVLNPNGKSLVIGVQTEEVKTKAGAVKNPGRFVAYAEHANEARPFGGPGAWGNETKRKVRYMITEFLLKNALKVFD
jgi:hypothetical protein